MNIALNKTAFMSSVSQGTHAGAAVDGNFNPSLSSGSCFHTQHALGSWWSVDLQKKHVIKTVILTNRDSARKYTQMS